MKKRSARIKLKMEKDVLDKINKESKRLKISRNEYINRSVFIALHEWSYDEPENAQIEILKNILDFDTDLVYYKQKCQAIARLVELEEKKMFESNKKLFKKMKGK